jgi:hypothetical protein
MNLPWEQFKYVLALALDDIGCRDSVCRNEAGNFVDMRKAPKPAVPQG